MRKLSREELIAHRAARAAAISPVAEVVVEEVVAEEKPKRKSKKNDTEVANEEHTHDENCEHSEEV